MTAVVIYVCFMPQILLNGIYMKSGGEGGLVLRQTRENRATTVLRKYIISCNTCEALSAAMTDHT